MKIDFSNIERARDVLREELTARLREQQLQNDSRVSVAIASLTRHEIQFLTQFALSPPEKTWGYKNNGTVLSVYDSAIIRLLDKGLITLAGMAEADFPMYEATLLGREVAVLAKSACELASGNRRSNT